MRHLFLFSLLLALPIGSLYAQDLKIYYNANTQEVKYTLDGDEIEEPYVKNGKDIFLYVTDYNNYLYNVKIETSSTKQFGSTEGSGNMLGFAANEEGGGLGNLASGLNFTNIFGLAGKGLNLLEEMGIVKSGFAAKEEAQVFMDAQNAMNTALEEMNSLEIDISNKQKGIAYLIEQHRVVHAAYVQIKALKSNPNMEPDRMKQYAKDYYLAALQALEIDSIDLTSLLTAKGPDQELKDLVGSLNKSVSQYDNRLDRLEMIKKELVPLAQSNHDIEELINTVDDIRTNGDDVVDQVKNNINETKEYLRINGEDLVTDKIKLKYLYDELQANTFTYKYRYTAGDKKIYFNITLEPKENTSVSGAISRNLPIIEVNTYGGTKINASMGISFTSFFNNPSEYGVRNGLIVASDKDNFTPVLATMFHLYRPTRGTFSPGISIGVGVPFLSSSKAQSITFLVGPSLHIGKNEAFTLTVGVSGGRTERLSNGYEVGDTFTATDGLLPTISKYELGYGVCFSFKLVGL